MAKDSVVKNVLISTVVVATFAVIVVGIVLMLRDESGSITINKQPPAVVTDTAVILGPPVAHVGGLMAYPIFVRGSKAHTWISANNVPNPLFERYEIAVEYNKEDLLASPHQIHHVKLISP